MGTITSLTDVAIGALIAPLVAGASIADDGTLTLTTKDGTVLVVGTVQQLNDALTAIAGLSPAANDMLQFISGNWANRTPAQILTSLSADLSTIAGLSLSNDQILQRKGGVWVARTMEQVYADMNAAPMRLDVNKVAAHTYVTTSLVQDADLAVTLEANTTYDVEFSFNYVNVGGMDFGWTVPAGSSGAMSASFSLVGSAFGTWGSAWANQSANSSATSQGIVGKGTLITSSTPGTFAAKFAEHTSSDNIIVGAGSRMSVRKTYA